MYTGRVIVYHFYISLSLSFYVAAAQEVSLPLFRLSQVTVYIIIIAKFIINVERETQKKNLPGQSACISYYIRDFMFRVFFILFFAFLKATN